MWWARSVLLMLRDVAGDCDGVRANVSHLLDRLPAVVLRQVQHRHSGPGLGQAYSLSSANPASRTGDEGDALMQCNHGCPFL